MSSFQLQQLAGQVILDGKDVYEPGVDVTKDSVENRYGFPESQTHFHL